MKKLLLLLCAFMASISGAWGEDPTNLARLEGTVATASKHQGDFISTNAIDGNTGSRWSSNADGNQDSEWFQIQWTAKQTFNTVKLLCEGAMNTTNAPELAFDIQVSDDGDNWTTKKAVTGKNAGDKEYITVILDESVEALYVRFQGVKKGNYGYSFYEFEVYNIDYSTQDLTSLLLPNPDKANANLTTVKVGQTVTIQALDQNSTLITSGVSYSATNGTITEDGIFSPTAAGVCTITATQGTTELTATVFAYTGDDLLLGMTGITNAEATNVNLFTDGNWGNRGGLGEPADKHTWVYYDLGAYYTISLVDLKQEQACGKNYKIQFSADGSSWTDAYTITNEVGMAGDVRHYFYGSANSENVRFIRFDCTEPATEYGVSIYEIAAYGVKTGEIADNEPPVLITASASDITPLNVKLTLKATDNIASNITYIITETAHSLNYETTGAVGTEITYIINGLEPETEYNFSVVANDGKQSCDAQVINVTTTTMSDIPAILTGKDKITIYSAELGNASGYGFFDWGGGTGNAITVNGSTAYMISNFKWYGSQFNVLDVSGMTTMHLDIYPFYTGKLCIVPINQKIEGEGNQFEKGFNFDVTAGSWNSLEIPIADIIARGTTMTKLYQIKYTGEMVSPGSIDANDGFANGDGTNSFIVGNVYFYKDHVATDLEKAAADANGVNAITGDVTASAFTTVTEANDKAYDLTGSYVDVAAVLTPANPNAVFIVTPAQKVKLAGTKNLVIKDGSTYTADAITYNDQLGTVPANLAITTGEVSYTRTGMEVGKLFSVVLPFSADIPTGFKAYQVSAYDGSKITFEEISGTTLSAGTAYVIKSETTSAFVASKTSTTLDFTEGTSTTAGVTTTANLTQILDNTGDKYVLSENKIKKLGGTAKVAAFRGYFTIPAGSNVIDIDLEGDVTGIENLKNDNLDNAVFYDLNGHQVANPTKGLYIVNGKKVILK